MTHFLSVWTGKRAVIFGLTLSVYTFTLMYVFRTVEHTYYNMLPQVGYVDASRLHSNSFLVSSYSRRSLPTPLISKISVVPAGYIPYNKEPPEIPFVKLKGEPPEIQPMNGEPPEIQPMKLNGGLPEIQSMKLNGEPTDIQPMKLNGEPPEIPSVKLIREQPEILSMKLNGEPRVILPMKPHEIPSVKLNKKPQQIVSVKLNVKRIPRNDNVLFKKNKPTHDLSSYFRQRLNDSAVKLLLDTMQMFDVIMTRNGLDYILYGGSLIGSYRHHGFVPWDDDIDVLVPLSSKSQVYQALTSLIPRFVLNKDWSFSWKLFSVKADEIRGYNWRWPYLDIFFYAENETHIWDVAPQYSQQFVFPKSIIFPLRRRPFMNLHLLAPYNSRAAIDTNYNINLCKSGKWIHKWERHGIETSVHCSVLYFKFPFVFRTFQNRGCNESLIHNDNIVGYYFEEGISCD